MRLGLVIIDATNNYLHPDGEQFLNPKLTEVIPKIAKLVEKTSANKVPYWFVITSCDKPTDPMSNKWGHHNVADTWATEIVEDLQPYVQGAQGIIRKTGYNAFHNTNLFAELERTNVGMIVLCGVTTDVSVQATAGAAFENGIPVVIVDDGTMAKSSEQHEAGLEYMKKYYGARVLNTI